MKTWDAARAASKRPLHAIKSFKPVGPTVVVVHSAEDNCAVQHPISGARHHYCGAYVNGVLLTRSEVFSLGLNVPELELSEYGPYGAQAGKRGDGLAKCTSCNYAHCRLGSDGIQGCVRARLDKARAAEQARVDAGVERVYLGVDLGFAESKFMEALQDHMQQHARELERERSPQEQYEARVRYESDRAHLQQMNRLWSRSIPRGIRG